MLTLRLVKKLQDQRSEVRLNDGRVGKIVRVDTTFPGNKTEVSVYTSENGTGPGIARVGLDFLSTVPEVS